MKSLNSVIQDNPFYMSPVEIIIPFHGEHSSVVRLIEGIFRTVVSNRYLITLVDDGSKNKSFLDNMKRLPGVRGFRQEHKGFGAAINLALKNPWKTPINWVVIAHSDLIVDNNHWLSNLGKTFLSLKNNGIKMLSPKTNNSENKACIGTNSKSPNIVLEEGYLPLYCALAHRELFKRVGDFKENPYAGGEAEDYAFRMRSMGFKQAVCGDSWVEHTGGKTLANFKKNKKVQEILRKVREGTYNAEPVLENCDEFD